MSSRRRGGPLIARIPDELALEVGETGNAAQEIADADLPGGAEIDPLALVAHREGPGPGNIP